MTIRIRLLRPIRVIAAVGLVSGGLLAGPLTGVAHAAPATFVVNTIGNAGDTFIDGNCDTSASAGSQCTLRGAIQEANGNPGPDTINFNLPSPYRITLTSSGLPPITSPVLIDGTSLPGYTQSGGTIVRVDGVATTTGVQYDFDVQPGGDGTTIKGLEIVRAGTAGIRLAANNNTVQGSNIGSTWNNLVNCASGSSCSDNVGILIQDGSNNTIGGTIPFNRNIISNNSYGVQLTTSTTSAANNVIQGNYIGTNLAGTAALPNSYGVVISDLGGPAPTGTVIGGTAAGAGNVISGNSNNGVDVNYGSLTIAGNIVGLNAAANAAVPNGGTAGLYLYGATTSATIGGASSASRNVISGNAQEGVEIAGPTGPMSVQNNYVGTDPTGLTALGNAYDGVYIYNSDAATVDNNVITANSAATGGDQVRFDYGSAGKISNNMIGLAADGKTAFPGGSQGVELNSTIDTTVSGNTISNSSSYGLYASVTDGLIVTNNKIGTDSAGTLDRGNNIGVYLGSATESTIGTAGAGNLISGNDGYGIEASSSSDSGIQGNLIGTDVSGTSALANGLSGIWLNSSDRFAIGGTDAGSGNVVAASGIGCCEAGIYFSSSDDNTLLGNRVGVGATGGSLPNNWVGIFLDSGSDTNQIGSIAAGGGNVVANNADAGVIVSANALRNQIRGNSIHDNGLLGIDLNQDGVTANDVGDPDFGANRLQNYPVLTTSASNASNTQVSGSLNSKPNRQYALDFYASTSCDPSGNGEGETYLGSSTVTTNGSGNASFQTTLPVGAPASSQITATATDVALGDTSEFSACLANVGGLPAASVANTSAAENAGNMVFTVTLSSAPVFTPVTVDYATADGTATSPADYTATSGTVTFNAGETTKTVNVPIVNDTLDEPDETFTLSLSNPTNAVIMAGQSSATATILDNDPPPTISIAVVPAALEPDTGSVNQTVTVNLSAASSLPVSVVIHTIPGTANEGGDYTPNAAYLTFNPGQTVQTFNVAVLGDTIDENDERYTVQLLSPTNATIGTGSRVATITDNDPPPNLSISDVSATEGNTLTKKFNFTLTLSTVSGRNVQVYLNTANGTAIAPADYVARSNVNVAIPAGTTTATFTVSVKGDTVVEPDETFLVNIDTGQTTNSVVVDSQGTGTIVNDD